MNDLSKVIQKYQLVQRLIFLLGHVVGHGKKTDNHEKMNGMVYTISMNFSAKIIKGKNEVGL